jgi:CarboxypepD_reg-like domain
MKKLLFLTISVFLVFAVNAKDRDKEVSDASDSENSATIVLIGTVADSGSGELLAGVEIQLEGTELKTYTDFDGNFTFNVKPGEYKVIANYISYNKCSKTMQVQSRENIVKIELENSK